MESIYHVQLCCKHAATLFLYASLSTPAHPAPSLFCNKPVFNNPPQPLFSYWEMLSLWPRNGVDIIDSCLGVLRDFFWWGKRWWHPTNSVSSPTYCPFGKGRTMKLDLSTGRPADPLAITHGVRGILQSRSSRIANHAKTKRPPLAHARESITFRYPTAEGSTRRYQFSILALGNVTSLTSFHASLSMLNQQSEAPRVIEGRDAIESRYALTVTERVKSNPVCRKTGDERPKTGGHVGPKNEKRKRCGKPTALKR